MRRTGADGLGSYEYSVHDDLGLIEVRYRGPVKIALVISYVEEVLSRDLITEGTIEYVDLSAVDHLEGDYAATRDFTQHLEEMLSRGWRGSVFHAPQEYQFGMVRMLGVVLENLQDAPVAAMIPCREPMPLAEVRAFLAEHGHR